jgi:hypothetical protein
MQQLRFALENEEKTQLGLPVSTPQEQQLIERMAQAILAVLQHRQGEEDESS